MLVSLHRIKGLEDGRLAIVKNPVGWVKDLLETNSPVFAWQVFLTGDPVSIRGHLTQELIVGDFGMRPVSQLEQEQLKKMLDDHHDNDLQNALTEAKALLDPGDIDSPEFTRLLHQAFNEAILRRAQEVIGVALTLEELGFWPANPPDGESYAWRSVFKGQEIEMSAAPGMFEDWTLWSSSANEREIYSGQRKLLNDWPRGRIIQVLLEQWEDVFGSQAIPRQLELGWIYRQHMRDMRAIAPVLPNIYVEGESYRRALRWLREAYCADEGLVGPPKDLAIDLAIQDGDVRLTTEDHSIGVKLKRGWVDPIRLSLRSLLAIPPWAVRGHAVCLQWTGKYALVNGYPVGLLNITERP